MNIRRHTIELGLLMQNRRLLLLPLLLLLICLPPFIFSLQEADTVAQEFAEIEQRERDRWLNQSPKNPHSADHFGTWVFKPVSPLSALDQGVTPYLGRMVRVEAHVFNDAVFQATQDANPLTRTGFSSVSDVIQLLLPLVMLIMGFAAFSSDKERGTIRLALGNGVAPRRWVGARMAALALTTAIAITVPLAALGLIALATGDATGWQGGIRLVLWLVANLVYAGIYLLLGMAISLICRTLRSSLTAVLLVWFVLTIAIPRVAGAALEDIVPTPSHADTKAAVDRETRAFNAAEVSAERERRFLASYGVDRAEDLPVDLRGAMLQARDEHDYKVFDRHYGQFFGALKQQDFAFGLTGILSPKIAVEASSEAISGNDVAGHVRFIWAAEHYRRLLSDTMNDVLLQRPQAAGETIRTGREIWERVPPFTYQPPSVAASLRSAVSPLIFLLVWLALAGGLVFHLSGRMKP